MTGGTNCPQCGSDRLRFWNEPDRRDPNTGYQEGGEHFQCLACGISGDGDELIDQPELDRVTGELALRRTIARVDEECGTGTDAAWAAMEMLDALHADALATERGWRPGL